MHLLLKTIKLTNQPFLYNYRLLSFDNLSDSEQQILIRNNSNKLIGYLWALYCEPNDMMEFTQGQILPSLSDL